MEIASSLLNLVDEEKAVPTFYRLDVAHVDYFHIDVMDGKYVEANTTDRMRKYCELLKNITPIPLDVHLMVKDVEKYIEEYNIFEPSVITFHPEAVEKEKVMTLIDKIKSYNIKVGLCLNTKIPVDYIEEYLPYIHNVLIMTVEAGKGGQSFMPDMLEKVKKLKKIIEEKNLDISIEVDGGVNLDNIKNINDAGADTCVVGTSLLNSKDYTYTVKKLKE